MQVCKGSKVTCLRGSDTKVKGRLRENTAFWQFIGDSQWLLKVLNKDYWLLFVEFPKSMFFWNHKSVLCNSEFVFSEISKLFSSGDVVEVSSTNMRVEWFGLAWLRVVCEKYK